jgi:hypothetical protein
MNTKQFNQLTTVLKEQLKTVNWAAYDMPDTAQAYNLVKQFISEAKSERLLESSIRTLDQIQSELLKTNKAEEQNVVGFIDAVRGELIVTVR